MKPLREMTQGEVAAFVDSHLQAKGIEVVLSGGASVAIHTQGEYVSADIDLVNAGFASDRVLAEAMSEIGFARDGRHFVHPEARFFVGFPPGPLAVGQEPAKAVERMNFPTGTLRIISPTDCVKDRLAASITGTTCSASSRLSWLPMIRRLICGRSREGRRRKAREPSSRQSGQGYWATARQNDGSNG